MSYKDILVHVDGSPASEAHARAALALAAHFGARVTALALLAEPFLRRVLGHAPPELLRDLMAQADEEADAVATALAAQAQTAGVTLVARRHRGPLDRLPTLLAREARSADLVVVGQPDPETGSADEALLVEAALMESGRPVLMVPATGAAFQIPRRAVIAWNASREAPRAVHDALSLLLAAEEVVVLVVDPQEIASDLGREPGTGVAAHLVQHGVAARVKTVSSDRRATGEFILGQAEDEGADLLVMGGYGRSRLRKVLMGGVTQHMLDRATMPVLLSH